jgi:GTP pyrophosphokinase/guanosine-3',5'-bis(diphosphate) 3'-pyrophosphohydrolase
VKTDLYPDAVYVFTPRSKILALPRGATPVDFAYAIHSDVGDHMVAAKVNNEPVALRTELRSGDVVEIITAPGARPNPGWLGMVRTGRARSKIRHYLKTVEAEESREMGEKMLAQALRSEGLSMPSADPSDTPAVALWQQLTRWSGNRHRGDLMVDIGLGRKVAVIVAKRMAQLMGEAGIRPDAVTLTIGRFAPDDSLPTQGMVFVDGGEGASVQFAHCCRPIPGEQIVGYLGRGEGLLVHTAECPTGKKLLARDSERWIHVEWAEPMTRHFETSLHVLVKNGKGVLAQVASAISSTEADITHLDMDSERPEETLELRVLISLRDRVHLAEVMRAVRRAPDVLHVSRYRAA